MAKQPQIAQTDYTRGGHEISQTALPYYKNTVNQLGEYVGNVQNRLDPYLDKYVNLASASQMSDFLRQYNNAVSGATANNYNATGGGYASQNQGNYDDLQRYYNDLASRMYANNLSLADNMATQEYNMLTGGLQSFDNAFQQGKQYSSIEQYNQMAEEANKNWWTSVANTLGDIGLSTGNPIGMIAGGALKLGAGLGGKDFSALDNLRASATGASGGYQPQYDNSNGQVGSQLGSLDWSPVSNWFNSKKTNSTSSPTNANTFSGLSNSFGFGLNTQQDIPQWRGFGGN